MKSRNSERERESALYHFYTLHASTLQNTSNKECSTQKTQRRITFIHSFHGFFLLPSSHLLQLFQSQHATELTSERGGEEQKNKLLFLEGAQVVLLFCFFPAAALCVCSVFLRDLYCPQNKKNSAFSALPARNLLFFVLVLHLGWFKFA